MDAAGGGSGSHWWGWSSWDSSHEGSAAEHNDSSGQWESWNGDRKSGAAEHGVSHEASPWNIGCKRGATEHGESWDAQNSWSSCRKSGAAEHDARQRDAAENDDLRIAIETGTTEQALVPEQHEHCHHDCHWHHNCHHHHSC